jgi:Ca2+-binding RTX toxin-like protein
VPTYSFETITAAQALAYAPTDRLFFASGTATQVSVAYLPNQDVAITLGSRTVEFGINLKLAGLPLSFPDHSSLFIGDDSDNLITFGAGGAPNAVFGGGGSDSLDLGPQGGLGQGNQGADTLTSAGQATLYGGQDNDRLVLGDSGGFAQGNKGDDSITGGHGAETLLGGQGDDTIASTSTDFDTDGANFLNGNLGNDSIHAGNGADQIFGEAGNDTVAAGYGDNFVDGGDGDDSLGAQLGANTIFGGNGNDTISAYSAKSTQLVDGGPGNDQIYGAGTLNGGDGNDTINGSAGAGTFIGATVSGGAGDDDIGGGNDDDSISGGDGNDTVLGGPGFDTLSGGSGGDVFQFRAGDASVFLGAPTKHDVVTDWTSADSLRFASGGSPDSLSHAIAGSASNYAELTAFDLAAAINAAGTQFAAGKLYVAAQVGPDVIVFANMVGTSNASDGVVLAGRTLADIDFTNFVH